tara:strand:- start:1340 stop:1738 length:399 start_codon:yes stop_codon:yes gene_type:complete
MLVHVLLYEAGKENEGIHSLEMNGNTIVLMFENRDDAERYCGLLEAQDFPCPTIEVIDRIEIEKFCTDSGYELRFVENGFVPKSNEDRLLLSPPEASRDVSNWNDSHLDSGDLEDNDTSEIDQFRKSLEDLL